MNRLIAVLAGAVQDRVFDLGCGLGLRDGVEPIAVDGAALAEYGYPYPIGAHGAVEDIDVQFKALVGRIRRRIPICDNDTAEGIGGRNRPYGHGIQRRPPEIGVDTDTGTTTRLNFG